MKKEIKKTEITLNEFIKAMIHGKECYLKKPKSWQRLHFWYEDLKDRWFINKAYDFRVKGEGVAIEESCWITERYLVQHLEYYERQGYKFHINE
jgi:hypothetical protein